TSPVRRPRRDAHPRHGAHELVRIPPRKALRQAAEVLRPGKEGQPRSLPGDVRPLRPRQPARGHVPVLTLPPRLGSLGEPGMTERRFRAGDTFRIPPMEYRLQLGKKGAQDLRLDWRYSDDQGRISPWRPVELDHVALILDAIADNENV